MVQKLAEEKKQAPVAAEPAPAKAQAAPQKPQEATPVAPKPSTATSTQQEQESKSTLDWKKTLKDFDLQQEATIDGKK